MFLSICDGKSAFDFLTGMCIGFFTLSGFPFGQTVVFERSFST
ncbi:hypothetical protein HMPREF3038_01852 [Akkermansia sp. KLE1797]|nr:hypothetical protein HMPREF3038_01852 [Akkermansia sp. KLE1797]KXU53872.1 hypothetical protein HMPREF3039_02011 [Akkermansia sp. KLE1798]KZA03233.1 hypothetical protein HMPREF1326_03277 [Akkermansia sp. KLE1605]